MGETTTATDRQVQSPSQRIIYDGLVLIAAAVLGVSYGILVRDWHWGAMAAISLCIVLGLAAQVQDLWRAANKSHFVTSGDRWGWRSAVAWRLAIMGLMVGHFLVQTLVQWKVLVLIPDPTAVSLGEAGAYDAVLLIAMIMAIAGATRLSDRAKRHSWLADFTVGVAACVFCIILVKIECIVPALIHITIVMIQAAQPLKFSSEALAVADPKRLAWFYDITTAGAISLLLSVILLRLFSLAWWRGTRWRMWMGALLGASLMATIALSVRIVLVEVPDITPAMAANMVAPPLHKIVAAAVLILLLAGAAALQWARPPHVDAIDRWDWRRDERRYYHEGRVLLWLLAGVLLCWSITASWGLSFAFWGFHFVPRWSYLAPYLTDWIESPQLCLSAAVILLALQSISSGRSDGPGDVPLGKPQLAPGLFLLIGLVLLTLIVFGIPILAAWGFALGFDVG